MTYLEKLYNKFKLEKVPLVMYNDAFKVTKYPGTALERMKKKAHVIFRKEWSQIKHLDEDTAQFLYNENISESNYISWLNNKFNLSLD